jgi:hypothetical protein
VQKPRGSHASAWRQCFDWHVATSVGKSPLGMQHPDTESVHVVVNDGETVLVSSAQ